MTMFGTLVQRLTSPVTSPTSSRRRFKSPSRWEVQSDPEDEAAPVRKSRAKHLLDKRKSKSRARGLNISEPQPCAAPANGSWHEVAFPPLKGTKSLGRLDGMKEVSRKFKSRDIKKESSLRGFRTCVATAVKVEGATRGYRPVVFFNTEVDPPTRVTSQRDISFFSRTPNLGS